MKYVLVTLIRPYTEAGIMFFMLEHILHALRPPLTVYGGL